MRNVFSADALALADTYGDPGRVIEVQQKVRALFQELAHADRFQQEAIKEQILEMGAWALPGLINSTYVFISELTANINAQKIITSLLVELAKDNSAGADLIFRIGFLRNPFPCPRHIALEALIQLGWQPAGKDLPLLENTLMDYRKVNDFLAVLDFYKLLLQTQDKNLYQKALEDCKIWTANSVKMAGELLALLIQYFPDRATDILEKVVAMIPDKGQRAIKNANDLLNPLVPIPAYFIEKGTLLTVSTNILKLRKPKKFLELLWQQTIKDYKQTSSESDFKRMFFKLGEEIQKKQIPLLIRYWFKAIGAISEIEYINDQTKIGDNLWRENAALQFFFMRRRSKQAEQYLNSLKIRDQELYNNAQERYDSLRNTDPEEGEEEEGPTDTGLE